MLVGVEDGEQQERQDHDMSGRDHHVVIRHCCKVCNRGFVSAGALGGHMRSHVMGDHVACDSPIASSGDKNKHSYYLRAKTTTTRVSFLGDQVGDDGENEDSQKSEELVIRKELGGSNLDPGSTVVLEEDQDLANCLVMLSSDKCSSSAGDGVEQKISHKAKEVADLSDKGGISSFQCKACKKVFGSHQALGGHRASHKKVKGCFAAKLDTDDDDERNHHADGGDPVQEDQQDHEYYSYSPSSDMPTPTKKSHAKMHECSVCRRVFTSGQALGGHKRCHWLTASSTSDNTFIPNFQYDHHHHHHHHHHQNQQLYKKPMITKPNHQSHDHQELDLNLNLPAPQHDQHHAQRNNNDHESSAAYLNQQEKAEKGCEVKLKKLSDHGDVNLDGGWLQMGFTSF